MVKFYNAQGPVEGSLWEDFLPRDRELPCITVNADPILESPVVWSEIEDGWLDCDMKCDSLTLTDVAKVIGEKINQEVKISDNSPEKLRSFSGSTTTKGDLYEKK